MYVLVKNVVIIILLFRMITVCAEVLTVNSCVLEICVVALIAFLVGVMCTTLVNLIFINR